MADKVFGSIYYIMYAAELFLIGEGIFHNRVKGKARYAAVAGVYLSVLILAIVFLDKSAFIIMALNMAMYMVLFQGNVISHIVHFGEVYLLTNMTESVLYGIGSSLAFRYPKEDAVVAGVESLVFAVLVTGVILCVINRKRTQDFIAYFRVLDRFQYLVVVMAAWSGILLLGSVMVMTGCADKEQADRLFAAAMIFMGTAFAGIVLLVWNTYRKKQYLRQNEIKEDIIRMQQMYCQNVRDNDREMRSFRHDIRSQLGCLQQLLADGKTREALEHLQMIGSRFEELTIPRCHTGNEILDIIMNQKIQEAEKKGIHIALEGRLDTPDFMNTYDLCALFSNMLNNSIEACEAVQGAQDKKKVIMVSLLSHRNTIFFRFANPATAAMYEAVKHGGTTKSDRRKHGFGMENVQSVVKQNGGTLETLFEDGKLIMEIYFEK